MSSDGDKPASAPLAYHDQPVSSRIVVAETNGSLTLTLPPAGTWTVIRWMLPGLPMLAAPLGVFVYFRESVARSMGFWMPIPWMQFLLPTLIATAILLAAAWWIGGFTTDVIVSREAIRVRRSGRFCNSVREWPAERMDRVKVTWFRDVAILDGRRRLLTRIPRSSRADAAWVAAMVARRLGKPLT